MKSEIVQIKKKIIKNKRNKNVDDNYLYLLILTKMQKNKQKVMKINNPLLEKLK